MNDFDWVKDIKMVTDFDFPESWSLEKVSREDGRRLKHLMYKHDMGWGTLEEFKKQIESIPKEHRSKSMNSVSEIFEIAERCEITMKDLRLIWSTSRKLKKENKRYETNPKPERKDNKHVKVGSGYSQGRTIRYPKKNRSRSVWARFYKLFPHVAKADEWDGKTSKRMRNDSTRNKR